METELSAHSVFTVTVVADVQVTYELEVTAETADHAGLLSEVWTRGEHGHRHEDVLSVEVDADEMYPVDSPEPTSNLNDLILDATQR